MKKIINTYKTYFENKLVVDLGSDTIKIACPLRGFLLQEPSLVIVEGNNIIAIGDEAKKKIGKTTKNSETVRPIKNSKIVDFDAAEIMIEYFLNKVNKTHENKLYSPATKVIVSAGSKLTPIEKRNIMDLFFKVGASKVSLYSQTMLAAIGSEVDINSDKCHFLLNMGAGTSEFIITSSGKIIKSNIIEIGGDYITKAIINEILNKEKLLISYALAEHIKLKHIDINRQNDFEEIEIIGQDKTFNTPKRINLKMKSLNQIVIVLIREMIERFIHTLNKTNPEIISDLYKNGMYLFGGTSRIKNIDNYISKILNSEIKTVDKEIRHELIGGIILHNGGKIDS